MVYELMKAPRIPLATYRLQFSRDFTFSQATELVPYLAELGVSHVYASPYLMARPGSTHGYDIIDHTRLNPEIGTEEDFEHFVEALHRLDMGQILDIVPNHMGVMGSDNVWWMDVLENGEASSYADFFDIDWWPLKEELAGKILVPVLGDQYGNVLDRGELKLTFEKEKGEFSILYFQHRFPVNPRTYPRILEQALPQLELENDPRQNDQREKALEFKSLITAFSHLPDRRDPSAEKREERLRDKDIHKRRLATLCVDSILISDAVDFAVRGLNGTPDNPGSFNALHELIKVQAFRLAYWRVAADDINYRRFFDVNDLAGLQMENETVFEATHKFVLTLLRQGKVDGLRIDHPDGLYDPAQYFERLHRGMDSEVPDEPSAQKSTYVVIEKILTGNEQLPKGWPVHGTTGYDFLNLLNGLFVDSSAAARMTRIYRTFIDRPIAFDQQLYISKKIVMHSALGSELNVLANALSRIALANRHTCDFTVKGLREAISRIVAGFPVYRTYITDDHVSDTDWQYIEQAIECAKRQSPGADVSVFDFAREVLLAARESLKKRSFQKAAIRFAMKFQQFTSPVMAKGLEDTSFYRYHRLTSLNDVGGDPRKFGVAPEIFHQKMLERTHSWPHSMSSTSTHDTKRSEDVRARINVLSEIPNLWRKRVRRWRSLNHDKKSLIENVEAPSLNDEYLLYQTLVGVWPNQCGPETEPSFRERVTQYMLKAVREAKEKTSWANPNDAYEKAVTAFVVAILAPERSDEFLNDFLSFQSQIARMGLFNSLSQTLLKLTAPGMPDIYQGNELWDLSLVDPDSRRPVDFEHRRQLLNELQPLAKRTCGCFMESLRQLSDEMTDGRIKLYLTWKTLAVRKRSPALFQEGEYLPLALSGEKADHLIAFGRQTGNLVAVVVVPRLCARLLGEGASSPMDPDIWKDTHVQLPSHWPERIYRNEFTLETLSAAKSETGTFLAASNLFANFPVALLTSEDAK